MAFAVDALGALMMNVGLFSGGLAFGIIGILFGASRGITKNDTQWALLFASMAWATALFIPHIWYAGFIFSMGTFALQISFMPLMDKLNEKNIFVLAIIVLILNVLILMGTSVYTSNFSWDNSFSHSTTIVNNALSGELDILTSTVPDTELCTPGQMAANDTACRSSWVVNSYIPDSFMPLATTISMSLMVGKVFNFLGAVALAPSVLAFSMSDNIGNGIIALLMGFMVTLWEFAIFYKLAVYVTNRWGHSS